MTQYIVIARSAATKQPNEHWIATGWMASLRSQSRLEDGSRLECLK